MARLAGLSTLACAPTARSCETVPRGDKIYEFLTLETSFSGFHICAYCPHNEQTVSQFSLGLPPPTPLPTDRREVIVFNAKPIFYSYLRIYSE